MGFTDNCDIFASFHEDGFNRIVQHVMQQRPSMFNYATAQIEKRPDLLCSVIRPHPIVTKRSNPLVTIVDPLPVLGTNYGINFAAQLTDLQIDFHPGNKFNLPPELNPPLKQQTIALRIKLCAGLGCPSQEVIDRYIPPPPNPDEKEPGRNEQTDQPIVPLPFDKLTCFCLEAYATCRAVIAYYYGKPYLEIRLAGFEIVDIAPEGLENSMECYISTLLRLSILPKVRILVEKYVLDLKDYLDNLKKSVFVTLTPTPVSAAVPNNPAVEQDQVKVFVNMTVTT
ncbi:MAG: hypothetical protein HGB11_11935 [Chlorobiales bacterium]|nr:hypothetical protein [Chlorobiales bacterium]